MHTADSAQPKQRKRHQRSGFGPIALFRRIVRWHTTAPLWQVLALTALLLGLIALTFVSHAGMLPHP